MAQLNTNMPAAMPIDSQRVTDAGVFVSSGKYITLYSDIDDPQQLKEWTNLFDQAVGQWCEIFSIDIKSANDWKLTGIIIQNETRIRNAGLIPKDLPKFPAGYNRGHEFWVFLQKDDYYTRHLILHEGTHAFMQWFLGSSGPPWYSEGMAEWIALHKWENQTLKLNHHITNKTQTPGWGRVKIIKDMVAASGPKSLDDVLNIPPTAFRDVKYYAWSWAGCEFFSHHRLSKATFNKLPPQLATTSREQFNLQLRADLDDVWEELSTDWYLYIHEIDYGTDVAAASLKPATKNDNGSYKISANSSWQTTEIPVQPGDRFKIVGEGEFIVGQTPKPWRCQSNGVTAEYYNGQPLGKLMATVISNEPKPVDAVAIGSWVEGKSTPATFRQSGQLALRINESPAKLGDNSGSLTVTIEKIK